jgi:hypothetical protein
MEEDIGMFQGVRYKDQLLPPQQAYLQFSALGLPTSFSSKPMKEYSDAYKKDSEQVVLSRTLDIFRQVLVELDSLASLHQLCPSVLYLCEALNVFKRNSTVDEFSGS